MLGALIGDISGSRFEWDNIKTKDFALFTEKCHPTDDSIMSAAVAQAILDCNGNYTSLDKQAVFYMQKLGRKHIDAGYGRSFYQWILSERPYPYRSYGNGAAMRVSACGFAAKNLEEAKALSAAVTKVTHNHQEGLKGAEAAAVAVYLARTGKSKEEIRNYIQENYYALDFTLDEIRPDYIFDVTCQGSVPQAIQAFLEADSFEDAIRNAVSIGGDSDTIAAIAGGIAEAYYGIPEDIRTKALTYLPEDILNIVQEFERIFPARQGVQ